MGIREKIEKLYVQHTNITTLPSPRGLSYEAILSILDEHLGELVLEEIGPTKGLEWVQLPKVNPGDHISIYVRRKKNESGS